MDIEAEENQDIDLEQIAADEANNENSDQGGEEVQLTETEQTAFDQGWRPQEEFEGPEDNWKTAKEYVRDGKFLATIKELSTKVDNQKKDFDSRLENTNKLHEARRNQEITALKKAQRDAVDDRDTQAYDDAQAKIAELESEQVETEQPNQDIDPVIDAWENKNTWIHDANDERSEDAKAFWGLYLNKNPNATNTEVLAYVDKRISKIYPVNNSNPRREQPNTTETPTRRSNKNNKSLSMKDLTNDEQNEYKQFGSMFTDEKSFLKAVSDTRAAR
jgi:hypothetical protein